jgi:hypothetical protein
LPGWDNCIVADWATEGKVVRYFGCELPSVATAEKLHAQRDTADSYLRSCLGKEWIRRRVPYQNGAIESNYEMGPDDPVERIRETIYTDGRGNILRIEVDAPQSAASAASGSSNGAPSNRAPTNGAPSNDAPSHGAPSNGAPANTPGNSIY